MQHDELILLIDRFHQAFPADPPGAFRDFLRVEERLRGDGDEAAARDNANVQSGLKKLELLGDHPQTMFKGMMRHDRSSSQAP